MMYVVFLTYSVYNDESIAVLGVCQDEATAKEQVKHFDSALVESLRSAPQKGTPERDDWGADVAGPLRDLPSSAQIYNFALAEGFYVSYTEAKELGKK